MRVAVIGAGSWGTALAQVLGLNGHDTVIWARRQEVADSINGNHVNPRYLCNSRLSGRIRSTVDMGIALADADAAVIVTPSSVLRATGNSLSEHVRIDLPVVICSKGVEEGTGLLAIDVLGEVLGNTDRLAVLSGPTHAEEVIERQPSATVIASTCKETTEFFQSLFANDRFRTYGSDDPVGVELCAAFKNVIAIAVGISYGMGFGDNTAAMLITRGQAEMGRMMVACGGQAITAMGLAGTGDMVVTCMSRHSRNRRFGQDYIAQGKTLADFEADTHMVVEGAIACKTLQSLSVANGVETPLTDAVRRIVWEGHDLRQMARELVDRPLKTEFYGF